MSTARSPALLGVAVVGVAAVAAFFVGEAFDLYLLRVVVKPWPVLALAVGVWLRGRRPYARPIACGLVLSALGDVLLELSEATFLPGVGAFLLAHVAYVVAFLGETKKPRWAWSLPFAVWGVAVVAWLRPGLEAAGMLLPVAAYTATICTMMWRAAARLGDGVSGARIAAVGAILFATSDTLIAAQRFGDNLAFEGLRYAIIVLYWLGQAAIAASTWSTGLVDWKRSWKASTNRPRSPGSHDRQGKRQ